MTYRTDLKRARAMPADVRDAFALSVMMRHTETLADALYRECDETARAAALKALTTHKRAIARHLATMRRTRR